MLHRFTEISSGLGINPYFIFGPSPVSHGKLTANFRLGYAILPLFDTFRSLDKARLLAASVGF